MKRSVSDYAQALYESVAAKPEEAGKIVERFARMLQLNNQSRLMPVILKAVEQIEREQRGIVLAVVETPAALSADQKELVSAQLKKHIPSAKDIEIQEVVRPELLGGIRLIINDQVIDNSIEAKLKKLKAQLA